MNRRIFAQREFGVGLLLVVTIVAVQLVNPLFLTLQNVRDLLIQAAPFAVMASGMTLVILLGEIDISIGSMAGVLAAILGLASSATHWGLPIGACALIVCLGGALLGAVNGLLVAYARIPSIIVTLGMLTILKGVTQVLLGGNWITDLPVSLRWFGTGSILGVPVPIVVSTIVVVLMALGLTQTPFGRRIYAVGSNPTAAHARGLPSKRIVLSAFGALGFLTGVATLISAPQLSVIESGFGNGWELFVVTCAVVGGVSIRGGRGSIYGAVLGVLLLGIVRTVLIFLKLGDQATYWERSIQGAFILGAVLADRFGGSKGESSQ